MTTNNLSPVLPFNFTQFSVTFGCEYKYATVTSLGYFQGDNQFKHSINVIFLQLGTAIFMNTFFRRILRPLNQPRFVSEMLVSFKTPSLYFIFFMDDSTIVIRLIAEDEFVSDIQEIKLDMRAITELKSRYEDGGRVEYEEVIVRDGVHTIEVLRSIDGNYDLILVGRRLDAESPLVAGLADWTYEPELGIVGDVLGSADMKSSASVLVIQQQSTVEDMLNIDRAKKLA